MNEEQIKKLNAAKALLDQNQLNSDINLRDCNLPLGEVQQLAARLKNNNFVRKVNVGGKFFVSPSNLVFS